MLNKQFSSVFNQLEINSAENKYQSNSMRIIEQDIEKILSIVDFKYLLKNLDHTKTMGCDEISPRILKGCASSLTVPITRIIKKSIEVGQLPIIWKQASVTPIYKGGSKLEAVNQYH